MGRPARILNLENTNHQNYVVEMLGELTALGFCPLSVQQHGRSALRFLNWVEKLGPARVLGVKKEALEAYRSHVANTPSLRDGGPVSAKTVYQELRSARLLIDHLLGAGILIVDPFAGFKMNYPKGQSRRMILTKTEVIALYEACENRGERALLALAYGCGLRGGEIENINREDIRIGQGLVLVEKGKNGKRRAVPISGGVARDLARQLERRNAKEHFLCNEKDGRLRSFTAQKRLKRLAARAGITRPVTVHVLRHSIASHLLEEGLAVEEVRIFLGHALLATTEIYTQVKEVQIREMMEV
jgi:integrase/recombinase XerD